MRLFMLNLICDPIFNLNFSIKLFYGENSIIYPRTEVRGCLMDSFNFAPLTFKLSTQIPTFHERLRDHYFTRGEGTEILSSGEFA